MGINLFLRNLAKCGQTITLQNRDIVPPKFGSADFDEAFSGDTVVTAIIQTERGKVIFDGVGTDNPITHKFCLEWVSGVTAETWILFGGNRYDIIDVEDCGEQNICLVLRCTERGTGEAAKA